MTNRTYNYTGRSRIRKDSIGISLKRDDEGERIESVGLSLIPKEIEVDSDNASVIIEGRYRTEYIRKELDSVRDIDDYYEFDLEDPIYSESLIFRLIVVNPEGKILAQADEINPREKQNQQILQADIDDIGRRGAWEIQYNGKRGSPVLVLNKNAGIRRKTLEEDSEFRLAVLPSAFRSILERLVFVEEVDNLSEPSKDWHKKWLIFSEEVLGNEVPEDDLNIDGSNRKRDSLEDWIDNNVESFTEKLSSDWQNVEMGWGE